MADIALRFYKDMLVLSSPVLSALARLGIDVERDGELTLLLEPDTIEDAYQLESIAGAQCLVADTASITPARLARSGMEARASELAAAALAAVRSLKPQHVLVEIGPCGLPLDASSKNSLNENRDQYARAGRLFANMPFDAFFLNGFASAIDLKCALMGLRKVSDAPIFASVDLAEDGKLANGRDDFESALFVMGEYGAQVAGFSTAAPLEDAVAYASRAAEATPLPLLVQLEVKTRDAHQQAPTRENPYYVPDTMIEAAEALRAAGVQFLRAAGDATPAYTGALVATVMGLDARERAAGEAGAADAAGFAASSAGVVSAAAGEGVLEGAAGLSAVCGGTEADASGSSAGAVVDAGSSDGAAAAGSADEPADADAGKIDEAANAESAASALPASDADLAAFVAQARARVAAALDSNLTIVESDGPAVEVEAEGEGGRA